MALAINDTAPDFEAQTTQGKIRFHDWLGDSWGVLFSHPKDFTPVCTTELGYMARIKPEFDERGVKIIGATSHFVTADLDAGPIIEQDVTRVDHRDSVQEMVRKGKDLEKTVLARAVWSYTQHRILVYHNKTVVFK